MHLIPYEPLTDVVPASASTRPHVTFDTETYLIQQGLTTPQLVCASILCSEWSWMPVRKADDDKAQYTKADEYSCVCDEETAIRWWVASIERAHDMLMAGVPRAELPLFIGQETVYDVLVLTNAAQEAGKGDGLLGKIFDLYEAGCFADTRHRAKLIQLGTVGDIDPKKFRTDLATLVYRELGVDISASKRGPDIWRMRYNELYGVPLTEWEQEALQYPLDDVYHTYDVYRAQCRYIYGVCDGEYVNNSNEQARAHLALALGSAWGFRTDPDRLRAIGEKLGARIEELETNLHTELFVVPVDVSRLHEYSQKTYDSSCKRKKGPLTDEELTERVSKWVTKQETPSPLLRPDNSVNNRVLKMLITDAFDGCPPLTDPSPSFPEGQVSTSEEVIKECDSPFLMRYAERQKHLKKKRDFVDMLLRGGEEGHPMAPRYDPLKETGRASAAKPNIMQIPRKGGERECFVPRPGYLYANADYDSVELRGWAYVCWVLLGISTLAEEYRKDSEFDPHIYMASRMCSPVISYEEALRRYAAGDEEMKDLRSLAKIPNFGYPGGMGAKKLRESAKKRGIELTQEKADWLKEMWLETWEEAPLYREHISDSMSYGDGTTVEQIGSKRLRAGCSYCRASNTYFQGICGDGAKEALWLVTREMYGAPAADAPEGDQEALSGSRLTAFIHDELLIESPIPLVHRAADRMCLLMKIGMEKLVKTVPIEVSASVSTRWSKDAKSTRSPEGIYSVWTGDETC